MQIQNAIFDLDGTLIDSMPTWRNLQLDAMGESLGRPLTDVERALGIQYPYPEAIKRLPDGDKCDEAYVRDISMERMTAVYHSGKIDLKPCVREYLVWLHEHGCKAALATATPRTMFEPYLKLKGIYDLFDYIVTADDVHADKFESPKIYETAMAALGGTKENTAVFEDVYFAIRTAKTAGFYTVAVDDGSIQAATLADTLRYADRFIRSYEEMMQ